MSLPRKKSRSRDELATPIPKLAEIPAPDSDTGTASRRGSARSLFLPVAGSLLLIGALLVAGGWWQYQSAHVITRNALVRSHLSELGVRGEGVIDSVFVSAGDRVREGQLLARLDDRHLLAQREQVKAAISTLEQRIAVDRAALGFAREKAEVSLLQARAQYRRMQAEAEAALVQAEDSRAFHAARQALKEDGAISAEVIRDAAAKARMRTSLAEAADAAAEGSYTELETARLEEEEVMLREGELRVLQAKHRESLAQLQRIDADIESTRVTAPADGAVIRRLAQPGMAVTTGMPLLSLWITEESWIEAWIPEESIGNLRAGAEVSVSFPALPGERFPARVERIGLATDFEMPLDYLPQTRESRMRPTPQIGVQIRLNESPELVRPGMSAVVDIRRSGV